MFCEKCGGRVNDGARFCSSCGAEIANGATAFEESGGYQDPCSGSVMTKGKKKAKKITLLIKNSLILLLAVIMFAFSFFPIIGVGTEYLGVDVKVNFSAIDSISILFSSFSNYSDIAEIPAYDDMMELSEMLQEELGGILDMSEKEAVKMFASEISRISILTIKASLMFEGAKAPIAYWFAAILSFIYMALTAAFFVLAILNFIATFGVIKTGKRFDLWCAALLSAATVSLLLLFYVMGVSYSAAASIISMTGFSVTTVIIAAVTVVYSIVQRMIFARNKNIKATSAEAVLLGLAPDGGLFLPQFFVQSLGQAENVGLAAVVSGEQGAGEEGGNGGHIQDVTVVAGPEFLRRQLGQDVDRLHIGVNHAQFRVQIGGAQVAEHAEAGVVDEHVHLVQPLGNLLHILGTGDVQTENLYLGVQLGLQTLQPVFPARHGQDVVAALGQGDGHVTAEAGTGTGNQCFHRIIPLCT